MFHSQLHAKDRTDNWIIDRKFKEKLYEKL